MVMGRWRSIERLAKDRSQDHPSNTGGPIRTVYRTESELTQVRGEPRTDRTSPPMPDVQPAYFILRRSASLCARTYVSSTRLIRVW